ncbi:hypothetical protein INS49_015591 [Diaporthe citri]|uniref:uncharacterized protein n=1 Tax=Diaporthe citri TaxID=83186 RepID=UPI001C814D2A|nr:uncharacterized protein INS49_015591 [Diaporthe citri]KAG6356204.1 hypothetical protein INS49_015591 [Diaporthe citri]
MSNIVHHFRPNLGEFEAIYQSIHKNAELSKMETQTARKMADYLSSLGFDVTEGVGGNGVVGVLRNGEGRCVMLRAELDALPIKEATGLPYACNKMMKDIWGQEQPVMHAAGHDLHMASLLAAATLMRDASEHWQGTLAMVENGLYNIAPVPDAIFGQHSGPFPAGHVNVLQGPALMSADTVRIKLYCSLGCQANPQHNAKLVALASDLVGELEQLAHSNDRYAHITVDEIHAGRPGQNSVSHVDLVLDVKTDNENIRQYILRAIGPKAKEVCRGAGVKHPPEVEIFSRAPLTLNNASLAEDLQQAFGKHFGEDKTRPRAPLSLACDDFSRLAAPHGIPYVMWHLGRRAPSAREPSQFAELIRHVPFNDSPYNAPVLRPTLLTGTDALALAALTLLGDDDTS